MITEELLELEGGPVEESLLVGPNGKPVRMLVPGKPCPKCGADAVGRKFGGGNLCSACGNED